MGIQGLLPQLRKVTHPTDANQLRGCRVAVDAYGWLHKGVHGCAADLGMGKDVNGYVWYCLNRVETLVRAGVHVTMVFDGGPLPSKEGTEDERKASRDAARERALHLMREGNVTAAYGACSCALGLFDWPGLFPSAQARPNCRFSHSLSRARFVFYYDITSGFFAKSVDVSPNMAARVIDAMRARYGESKAEVDWIVAPYEADAQLAYLARQGLVDAVISEDSDNLPYGVGRVVFKWDGRCGEQVLLTDVLTRHDLDMASFSQDM